MRNHLLTLGTTESQIQNIQAKSLGVIETSPLQTAITTTTTTSVVEILHLWQNVFRETFQQYHRLSTRLVRSEDSAAALRLWQEYLYHVQAFLSGSIPEDYNGLTEHQHLCEVHQNLLSSQQNVLLSKKESVTDNLAVMQQFNALTNLHNETLARIMERHTEVKDRIQSWDSYRKNLVKLLAWLNSAEKDKGRLQLRYLHLRRIPKILARIECLLDKVPNGEKQCDDLKNQQTKVLLFCDDEALATSVRMEHAAIVQRISSLQAGLRSWYDFIQRIIKMNTEYDSEVIRIQNIFNDIQNQIQSSNLDSRTMSHSGIYNKLEMIRSMRDRVTNTTKDLDNLSIIQEQLKELLSPADMKIITQKLWLLTHQQGDLDHQLSSLIHLLEERLNLRVIFDTRQTRFINWASQLESRIQQSTESSYITEPEELVKKLESELNGEMAMKDREWQWLVKSGDELLNQCDDLDSKIVSEKVDEVRDTWKRLQDLGKVRANKLQDMVQTKNRLEIRIAEIRAWLQQIESELAKP